MNHIMKKQHEFMRHLEVLRLTQVAAKKYPGGITAIADTLEKSEVILANKLNPDYANNHLTLDEFAEIVAMTGDHRPLQAIASMVGRITIPKPDCSHCSKDTLAHFLELVKLCGEIGQAIQDATADDSELGEKLSRREREQIMNVLDEMLDAVFCLRQVIQQ